MKRAFTLVELLTVVGIIALVLTILFGVCVKGIVYWTTSDYVTFTVKTERVGNSDGKYLVFTGDEVFEDTDTLWYWKYNSSDIYGRLLPGKTYKAKVCGIRWHFMSWYRNIIELEDGG